MRLIPSSKIVEIIFKKFHIVTFAEACVIYAFRCIKFADKKVFEAIEL